MAYPNKNPNHNMTRYCEICGDLIPTVSKTGKPIAKQTYNEKKTCGSQTCYKAFKRGQRNYANVQLSPLDAFLSGKTWESETALIKLP